MTILVSVQARVKKMSAFAGAAALIVLSSGTQAADLQGSVSCVEGNVPAYDYAELEQNFAETSWDRRSRVSLRSEDYALTLEVIDLNGNSICEEIATLRTRCTWNLNAGGTYTVKIDNSNRSTASDYRLCAE